MMKGHSRRAFLRSASHILFCALASATIAKAKEAARAPIVFTHYMHCYVSGAINSHDAAVKYYRSNPDPASSPPVDVESQWFLSGIGAGDIGGQNATDADLALMASIGINAAGLLISPTHLPSSPFASALHMAARSAAQSSVKLIPELWFDAATTDPEVYGRTVANFLQVHPNSGFLLDGRQVVLLSYLSKDAAESFDEPNARDYLDRLFKNFGGRERIYIISNLPFGSNDSHIAPFAKFSDALGAWIPQDDWLDRSAIRVAEVVAEAGKDFVEPIAQGFYQRRRDKLPWEYGNSFGSVRLTNAWRRAIENRPKFIEIETWNDFSEDTDLRPSNSHGFAYIYITQYFIKLMKEGPTDDIKQRIIIFHPRQSVEAELDDGNATCENHSWRHRAPMCDYLCIVTILKEPAILGLNIGKSILRTSVQKGFNESLFIKKTSKESIPGDEVKVGVDSYPISSSGRTVEFLDENLNDVWEATLLTAGKPMITINKNVSLAEKGRYCDLTVIAQCVDLS